ncbi:hypothetical protein FB451DRAFT_1164327 [Mycena latifolia]|nr:hypothetical protein FB451DRAFT_1164327 [Mycena latifolia]
MVGVKREKSRTGLRQGFGRGESRVGWGGDRKNGGGRISDWIISCLVKSQSNIHPADRDSTSATINTGETQHHWTNTMTGINLSLAEAIESARELDEDTAREIEAILNNGIFANSPNEAYHRMSRNLQRQSKETQRAFTASVQLRIDYNYRPVQPLGTHFLYSALVQLWI